MDVSLQAVLLFHNHQVITPNVPFTGNIAPAMAAAGWSAGAAPAQEPPPAEPEPQPQEEQPNG